MVASIYKLPMIFTLVLIIFLTGCNDKMLGNKTIEETFTDKNVVLFVYAILDEDISQMNKLIKKGVNVNSMGLNNVTPLVWAASKMKLKSVEALLKAGADPHKPFTRDHSVFSMLVGGNKTELLKVFIAHSESLDGLTPKGDPLIEVAVLNRRWKNLELLLDAGADINNHAKDGVNAANTAVAIGSYDKALYLLERGYSYNLKLLARSVQRSATSVGEQCEWKKKVAKKLEEKGIRFPVIKTKRRRVAPDSCVHLDGLDWSEYYRLHPDIEPPKE
jgi:hypothetical protein